MIRALLVDDQRILRESLKMIIEQDTEILVIDTCENGVEAIEACAKYNPDIVIMDIMMPIMDGVEATRRIKGSYPEVKVLILTTFKDDEKLHEAVSHGADGYILKDMRPKQLLLAIKSTMEGLSTFHDELVTQAITKEKLDYFMKDVANHSDFELNTREKEIIEKIVEGKSNKEIAWEMDLSEGTVRNMISNILTKVQVKDRTQLAVYAIKRGWI